MIELATPHLLRQLGPVESVVVACGEAADRKWNRNFQRLLHPVPVKFLVEPAINYISEQRLVPRRITRAISAALKKAMGSTRKDDCLVWAHNLGIGRNLILSHEVIRACAARNVPLVSHHHDWWFDNRWLRWPEMRRSGYHTLNAVARAVFPQVSILRHAAINRADSAMIENGFPDREAWLPNPAAHDNRPPAAKIQGARRWLLHKLGGHEAPVWILPCRLLRRKNVAEALLLTRWLRPEAWLVITGGVSSADELPYYQRLTEAAHHHHWRLRLGVLQGDEMRKPSVPELLAASEAVMLTSIQEGFGLPFLEAASAQRPLIARQLPNIAPDLKQFGFHFPQYYADILVDPRLFNWKNEYDRQTRMFHSWKSHLPQRCRGWAETPALLAFQQPQPVPFSRLTLTAQIEVLSEPARLSWALCAPLNPFLTRWQRRALQGRLQTTPWPRQANRWLGGPAYAQRFHRIAYPDGPARPQPDPATTQESFIREKLRAEHLFPLLWNRES